MGKTSTKSKDKYNESNYARYTLRVRKDSDLFEYIEEFSSGKGASLNYLITKLLSEHFESIHR